ncbi:MAG: S46 family peptidase [Bacteroidales bacterium]|nr:S46 family peptidase [Bacteroidales bacterium]MDD4209848.1 S46 family peptidase [Bacteroidales bacterium]
MRKISLLLSVILMLNVTLSRADEGMWLLSLLKGQNIGEMQKKGLKLSAEQIYDVNNSSLKDAIIGLGNAGRPFWHFCTGEIVSGEGLFFTNHHCGFGMIQSHSTVEHDYLADGFWAYSKDQELPNEGITASILVRMEDVTADVMAVLNNDMTEKQRKEAIDKISKTIADKAIEGTKYNAYVADVFNSNQFFLFVHIIYEDVRLVGAPPSSMGKFGGDTDNWMWPRHTADFSMFRIYTAPDGSPAPYAKENIPLKPKHFLPVSIKGIQDKDYAMILGFPGTTNRYITSYGLQETMDVTNKLRYEIRDVKIDVLRKEMASDQKIRIQYASKYASCSNYWKYSNEQNKALKALNTMDVKREIEKQYLKWAEAKDAKYTGALQVLEQGYANRKPYATARMYLLEGLLTGPELPYFAVQCSGLIAALESGDQEKTDALIEKLKSFAVDFYKDYNPETERKLIAALFEYTYKNMDPQFYPDFFTTIETKFKGDFNKYAETMFSKSIFATQEKFNAFLAKPNLKVLKNDLAMLAGQSIYEKFREVSTAMQDAGKNIAGANRLFVEGILDINKGKAISPDANSTIRLTYGTVGSYLPRDAVFYNYYTTLKGVMEKEDPTNTEFIVPQKLKDLFKAKDFGQYANEKGELVTCFITNNDITGGNSGSPVINANGELIGLAFDGNSEAMSGDIDFEENMQRCINLDVRYALFIIDKYAGAQNLIKEMTIVK